MEIPVALTRGVAQPLGAQPRDALAGGIQHFTRHLAGGEPRRLAFEQPPYGERVQEILHRIGPHHQRPVALALQRALAFQPAHRLAYRRTRHTEPGRDLTLGDESPAAMVPRRIMSSTAP